MAESGGLGRRDFIRAATVTGVAAAATLAPISFAEAASGSQKRTIRGHFEPGVPDLVYLPVRVPRGVNTVTVEYHYDTPDVPDGTLGNSCDIGIFDERGTAAPGHGFRGWSGGARTHFTVGTETATPGYLPGPIRPGTWHVALGPYQVAPQGMNYSVTVTLDFGRAGRPPRPVFPPRRAAGRGHAWYRGDCHLHTVYSDGSRTPAQVAAAARGAKLDFIATSDHNTTASHPAWAPYAGEDLMIMLGEEVTTRNGHWLALGLPPMRYIDWRYRARDGEFPDYARDVARHGGLRVAAHPFAPWVGCQWKFGYAHGAVDAVEVWNGPWTLDDEMSVSMWDGLLVDAAHRGGVDWPPAMGDSDAHRDGDTVGLPQNVVRSGDLTQRAILAGLRAGHCWIAESSSVGLSVTARGGRDHAGIGERLRVAADTRVTVTAEVSGVPHGTVRFISDEGQINQVSLPASGTGEAAWTTTPAGAAYLRVEVRHPLPGGSAGAPGGIFGAMAALGNPIFLGHPRRHR